MQTTNDPHEFNNYESLWHSLSEYSLSEVALDEDLEANLSSGPFFRYLQELGLPSECLKRIARTITETARNYFHRIPGVHVRIRLFYQPKMVTSLPHSGKQREGGFLLSKGARIPCRGFTGNPFQLSSCTFIGKENNPLLRTRTKQGYSSGLTNDSIDFPFVRSNAAATCCGGRPSCSSTSN